MVEFSPSFMNSWKVVASHVNNESVILGLVLIVAENLDYFDVVALLDEMQSRLMSLTPKAREREISVCRGHPYANKLIADLQDILHCLDHSLGTMKENCPRFGKFELQRIFLNIVRQLHSISLSSSGLSSYGAGFSAFHIRLESDVRFSN